MDYSWQVPTYIYVCVCVCVCVCIYLCVYIYISSHEIKIQLLLGRKAMTNLNSVLKSKDITLPTKVHIVNAMIFPLVKYGCESWTIKKAECQRTDAFKLCAGEDS